jgi:sulfide:quinone oxidoreductase
VQPRVIVLGAGFGGLELATVLSDEFGDDLELTLIDKGSAFVFGFSKLDVMFGRTTPDAVRLYYRDVVKPGVRFLQETVTAIDPAAKRVTTDAGVHQADFVVLALGADYNVAATPGLAEAGSEFYSVDGAERLVGSLARFSRGRVLISVCGTPYKCPPAPSETALLLHDLLTSRGVRGDCEIAFSIPLGSPVPPSPETSRALVAAFAERGIEFVPGRLVTHLEAGRRVAVLDDGNEIPFDLFLAVPKHRVPDVVARVFDLAADGFVPVSPATMETQHPGVYAIGDVNSVGVPKAGVFAEGQARVAAAAVIAAIRGGSPIGYDGRGSCYIEFGAGRVGRVDVDFFSGPAPTGRYWQPTTELVAEKHHFGSSRAARWFGSSQPALR